MVDATFEDPMVGMIRGHDFVNGLFDQAAKLAAGRAYQKGDVRGAAGLLASRGQIDQARTLNDQATTTDALTAANSGDYAGARAAAAKGGDAALYGQTTAAQQQDRAQRLQWMGNATDALLQVGAGLPPDQQQAKRAEAFQQYIVPTLKAMQVPDDQIANINAGHFTDDSLNGFKATIGQMDAMDIQKTDDGDIIGLDKKTGAVKVLHHSNPKPVVVGGDLVDPTTGKPIYQSDHTKYMTVTNDDGTTSIVPVGGGAAGNPIASGAGGGTPPPPAPGDAVNAYTYFINKGYKPAAAAGIVGNLFHESSLDPNAHNPQDGARGVAQWRGDRLTALQQYAAQKGTDWRDRNTQLDFVDTELKGPEKATYAALQTAKDPVSAAAAFAGYERPAGWKPGGDPSQISGWDRRSSIARSLFAQNGASVAVPVIGQPIATGSHSGKPRWTQLPDGRQQDTRTGKIEGTATEIPDLPGDPKLSGEAYLNSIPPSEQAIVRMMVTGRMAPPTSFALGKPEWQRRLMAAAKYDPSFDQTSWFERKKAAADYSPGGKAGQNITALNTAIGHLGHLYDQVGKLQNFGGALTPLNGLINQANTATGWTGAKTFDQTKEAVTDEAIRVFKQSGGNMEEAKRWADSLKSSDSPQQLYANIKNLSDLLRSRIEANEDTYKRTMGPNAPPVQFVSPTAQSTLQRIQRMGRAPPRRQPSQPKTLGDGWRIVQ